jgi:Rod binding domain-containing protein
MFSNHDTNIMASLARNNKTTANSIMNLQNTKKAAQELSGQFIQIILEEGLERSNSDGGFFGKGHSAEMIRSMFVGTVAKSMASTGDGLGITSMLQKAIQRQQDLASQIDKFQNTAILLILFLRLLAFLIMKN